ncbi:MAG: ABC transporter ATP-binding protein [Nitratireductor sp.]
MRAVDGVDLRVAPGETVGIVGESGCGKSTLARIALRLIDPTAGQVFFDDADVTKAGTRDLRPVRRRMQAIFQDPLASLNARMTISQIMSEPFSAHGITPEGGVEARKAELLHDVGLGHIDTSLRPRQFSGGQLQRIAIARALAVEPDLIVADEPTSALDPSIQAQIVNLVLDIRRKRGIGMLVISHDLDVIGHISDRIVVMYLGQIVESAPARELLALPLHPYAQALLSAAPTLRARRAGRARRQMLEGDPPNPAAAPPGCRFHPRCPLARDLCRHEPPALRDLPDGRRVACHFAPDETAEAGRATGMARLGRDVA